MPKMSESELLAAVNEAERDAVRYSAEYMKENEDLLNQYNGEPYGDEQDGQSQVVTSDVQDTVESDMPGLVRIFLGSKDVMTFEPVTASDADNRSLIWRWWCFDRDKDIIRGPRPIIIGGSEYNDRYSVG